MTKRIKKSKDTVYQRFFLNNETMSLTSACFIRGKRQTLWATKSFILHKETEQMSRNIETKYNDNKRFPEEPGIIETSPPQKPTLAFFFAYVPIAALDNLDLPFIISILSRKGSTYHPQNIASQQTWAAHYPNHHPTANPQAPIAHSNPTHVLKSSEPVRCRSADIL